MTAMILLQQPVEELEAGLRADRPPDTDLGGVFQGDFTGELGALFELFDQGGML